MPRVQRKKSNVGIYHVMMRGINRQSIFEDDEDNKKFIEILSKYRNISRYDIYAFCLMGNHVHILIRENEEDLGQIMRRICGSYVYWFNCKYERIGPLFQDRYKSEPIEDDVYLLTVLRYIYQNPVKAEMVYLLF
jgi:putative transposase